MKTTASVLSSLGLALAFTLCAPAVAQQTTKPPATPPSGAAAEQQCLAAEAKAVEKCRANCVKIGDSKECPARCDKRDKDAKEFCKKPQV
jgi:hypothetical protein